MKRFNKGRDVSPAQELSPPQIPSLDGGGPRRRAGRRDSGQAESLQSRGQ